MASDESIRAIQKRIMAFVQHELLPPGTPLEPGDDLLSGGLDGRGGDTGGRSDVGQSRGGGHRGGRLRQHPDGHRLGQPPDQPHQAGGRLRQPEPGKTRGRAR